MSPPGPGSPPFPKTLPPLSLTGSSSLLDLRLGKSRFLTLSTVVFLAP